MEYLYFLFLYIKIVYIFTLIFKTCTLYIVYLFVEERWFIISRESFQNILKMCPQYMIKLNFVENENDVVFIRLFTIFICLYFGSVAVVKTFEITEIKWYETWQCGQDLPGTSTAVCFISQSDSSIQQPCHINKYLVYTPIIILQWLPKKYLSSCNT